MVRADDPADLRRRPEGQAAWRLHHGLRHPGVECAAPADARPEPRGDDYDLVVADIQNLSEPVGARRDRRLHLLSRPLGRRDLREGTRPPTLRRQVVGRTVRRTRGPRPRRPDGQRLRRPQGLGRRPPRGGIGLPRPLGPRTVRVAGRTATRSSSATHSTSPSPRRRTSTFIKSYVADHDWVVDDVRFDQKWADDETFDLRPDACRRTSSLTTSSTRSSYPPKESRSDADDHAAGRRSGAAGIGCTCDAAGDDRTAEVAGLPASRSSSPSPPGPPWPPWVDDHDPAATARCLRAASSRSRVSGEAFTNFASTHRQDRGRLRHRHGRVGLVIGFLMGRSTIHVLLLLATAVRPRQHPRSDLRGLRPADLRRRSRRSDRRVSRSGRAAVHRDQRRRGRAVGRR